MNSCPVMIIDSRQPVYSCHRVILNISLVRSMHKIYQNIIENVELPFDKQLISLKKHI